MKKQHLLVPVFSLVIIGVGYFILQPQRISDNNTRSPASLLDELSRPRHSFSPQLVDKLVFPLFKNGQRMVQSPVVPRIAIERVLKELDQNKSIPYQLEMKYGLHPYATSFYPDDKVSYGEHKNFKLGVAPNCMVCHASRLGDQLIVGLGNTRVDLKVFFHDITQNLSPTDYLIALPELGRNLFPTLVPTGNEALDKIKKLHYIRTLLRRHEMAVDMFKFVIDEKNQSDAAGHSNPWSFAVQLFNWRDKDMEYLDKKIFGRRHKLDEVVLDPMPWWTLKYKDWINYDGIIRKSHRSVVQAAFSPGNSGKDIRALEPLFKEILEEAEKIEPPNYPHPERLNLNKVVAGERHFNNNCMKCHGVYSEEGRYRREPTEFRKNYSAKVIRWAKIKTDRQRLDTLNFNYLKDLEKSWLAFYGDINHKFRENWQTNGRDGYVAPPLWGIWASAPYFHNGSVPNLTSVLFSEQRPQRWRLTVPSTQFTEYDFDLTGLRVEINPTQNLRDTKIYDTTKKGMSNRGHEEIFDDLSESERLEILEYLKTL